MEYQLKLEQRMNYKIFWTFTGLAVAAFFLIWNIMGTIGYGFYFAAFLCFLSLPLLIGRYKFLLFLWIFIVPVFESQFVFNVGSINPMNYLFTGLTIPIGFYLIYKTFGQSLKDLPFLYFVHFLQIVIFLNILRPGVSISDLFWDFRVYLVGLLFIYLTYAALKTYNFDKMSNILYKWITSFVIINAILSFFQRIAHFELKIIDGVPRATGLSEHPNGLALMAVIYLPLAIYMLLNSKIAKEKIFWFVGVLAALTCIVLSFCKTALILLMIIFTTIFLYLPIKLKFKIFLTSVIFIAAFLAIDLLCGVDIIKPLMHRFHENDSLNWRIRVWTAIIHDINLRTLLIGNGPRTVETYIQKAVTGVPTASHNLYLKYIYEYGIGGLAMFAGFFLMVIKFFKASISSKLNDNKFYIVPFLVAVVVLVDAFFDPSGQSRISMNVAWIILTISCLKLNKEQIIKHGKE